MSINGANRLGSNSLTECLVFGARVGRRAAQDALEATRPSGNTLSKLAQDEEQRLTRT